MRGALVTLFLSSRTDQIITENDYLNIEINRAAELKGDKKFRIKIYQKYVNFSSGLKWQLDYICNIYDIVWETVSNGRTHEAPYRGHGLVPLRFGGNVVMRMGTQQQNSSRVSTAWCQKVRVMDSFS